MTSIYYKMCVYIYIFMFVQLQSTRFFDNQRSSSCILQTLDLGCHGWPHAHRPPDVCLFWRSHFLNSPKKWGSWSLSKIPRWSNSNMCIIIILKQPHLDLIHSGCDYTNIHTCMYICVYIYTYMYNVYIHSACTSRYWIRMIYTGHGQSTLKHTEFLKQMARLLCKLSQVEEMQRCNEARFGVNQNNSPTRETLETSSLCCHTN